MAYYYRKTVNNTANDIKLKMQLGALTLKISENNNKIGDLIGVDKNIKKDIISNTTKIDTYIKALNLINTNTTNNSNDISNNLTKINEIKADLDNMNLKTISKYSVDNFYIYNIGTVNNYRLNKDIPKFCIFNYVLNNIFNKDNILEINCRLLYQYTYYNNIGFLLHIFKLYDNDDTMFYEYNSPIVNLGDYRQNDIKQIDTLYAKLDKDYDYIKVELILSIVENVTNNIDCKLYNTYNSNYLCIKNYKKIDSVIIEYDNIKNSIYLKNIYNILFYDEKIQIDFRNLFYEKYLILMLN